jgi:hypothetical protein
LAEEGEFIMSAEEPEVTAGIDTDRGMDMDMAEDMDERPPCVDGAEATTGSYMTWWCDDEWYG